MHMQAERVSWLAATKARARVPSLMQSVICYTVSNGMAVRTRGFMASEMAYGQRLLNSTAFDVGLAEIEEGKR